MKLQALAEKTRSLLPPLCCPLCGEDFSLTDSHSLQCPNRHCYDLSRKGYINLAPGHNQQTDKYGAALFVCREALFSQGFFDPVLQAVGDAVAAHSPHPPALTLLDAGCGEGAYARYLAARFPEGKIIGVDISRDAIIAAAKHNSPAHWLVGDISRLPIRSGSLSVLLNILTPAAYDEFSRVLQPGGLLIKIIPGADYLCQLRKQLPLRQSGSGGDEVLAHLQKHAHILEQKTLRHTHTVSAEQAALFARMTPMTFQFSDEQLAAVTFSEITIHLELLVCQMLPSP